MIIGFTGTQKGMTPEQAVSFVKLIVENDICSFHHGDCIGADKQAHNIVCSMYPKIWVNIYPPDDKKKRAFCKHTNCVTYPPKPYLKRNQDIVYACELLIACPKSNKEELRSGTWATIRFAKKVGVRTVIIFPSGYVITYPKGYSEVRK